MVQRLLSLASGIARRKPLAVLLAGIVPVAVRLILLPWMPPPEPRFQDEFTNLLLADTLMHGRVVNPTHPMWVHFESMHILVRPVYGSVFPVAQGALLAGGTLVTGHPWSAVVFSIGVMCAALCWMLQGWVPPPWALLGAALVAIRIGVLSYWMNSYCGGAVAAIGGALLLGALPRFFRHSRLRDAALMGLGIAILANSRPYEGMIFTVPVGIALVVWSLRHRSRIVALWPMAAILAAAGAALAWYSWRFTGDPLQLPYSYYRTHFTMAPHFIWQSPRPEPEFHHRVMHHYHAGWELAAWRDARNNGGTYGLPAKIADYGRFYFGAFLAIPFLTLPCLWKRRRTRMLLMAGFWFALALTVEVWHSPHYAAPALGLAVLLSIESLRQLRQWRWRGWRAGTIAVGMLLALAVAFTIVPAPKHSDEPGTGQPRAAIVQQLAAAGGRHLVIVRHRLGHDPGDEWIYNSADIDSAPIVWAREMDPASNRELFGYFADRRVWLCEPDLSPPRLTPYAAAPPPELPQRFVRIGTDAISALRSIDSVRGLMRGAIARDYPGTEQFTCDQWNLVFLRASGIQSPDAASGCFSPGDRGRAIPLEAWLAWLRTQR